MAVIFSSPTRHGPNTFAPGVSLAFEDARAEDYFVAAGWASTTKKEPAMTYPEGTVEIDPQTVFADGPNKGALVMEEVSNG
jgi:hypothetical protein